MLPTADSMSDELTTARHAGSSSPGFLERHHAAFLPKGSWLCYHELQPLFRPHGCTRLPIIMVKKENMPPRSPTRYNSP